MKGEHTGRSRNGHETQGGGNGAEAKVGARTSHVSSRKSFVLRPPKPPNTTMDLWHATAVWACRGIGATSPELRDHSFVHAFCAATGQSASRASNRRICVYMTGNGSGLEETEEEVRSGMN